jgi:hypothetical protein
MIGSRREGGEVFDLENCCTRGLAIFALVVLAILGDWHLGVFLAGSLDQGVPQ